MSRIILYRSIYLLFTPVFLLMAILACAGTPLVGTPLYTCPTNVAIPKNNGVCGCLGLA